MTLIVKLLRYNDLASSCFGIFFNSLLLFLILTVKKNQIELISKTLLPNCLLDLFLSITTFFAGIQVTVIDGVCYLIVGSPMYVFGFTAASVILVVYGSSLILSIQAMPVPFFIRYLVICRDQKAQNKHVIIPYSIVFGCFFTILILLFWCYPPNSEHYEQFRPATMIEFWTSVYPNGPVFVAAKTISVSMLVPLGIIFFTTFASYALIVVFSIKITRNLHAHAVLHPSRKVLHKQLNMTLIIQALGPFFTGNLPVICLLIMIVFNIESPYPLLYCSFLLGWVACVSPLAAIIIMAPYRRRVKEIFKLKPQVSTMPTIVISSTNKNNCKPIVKYSRPLQTLIK